MHDDDGTRFREWADRWLELATYPGPELVDSDARIAAVTELWSEPVPRGWERDDDPLMLDPSCWYRRSHPGRPDGPVGEALIEYQILSLVPTELITTCPGGRLIDGINALSLQKDSCGGGRSGNVEADMLLLVGGEERYLALVVEVKSGRDTPWYAVVENLRQLRLYQLSAAAQRVLRRRRPDLDLPDALPTTGVVLAPAAYYTSRGKKEASVPTTHKLLDRMHDQHGIDAVLTTWDPERRVVEPLARS